MIEIVHLHTHSEYSLQDSIIRISELVTRVKELDMSAVALTDHGNVSGLFEFYVECKEQGVKPIVGMEAYVVPNVERKSQGEQRYHMVLLAVNRKGYQNLLSIADLAGTKGFYYVPRIDLDMVKPYTEGIIALTGCLQSVLYMIDDDEKNMARMLRHIRSLFSVYLEFMPHNMKEQRKHNLKLYNLAQGDSTICVVTQDCHYMNFDSKKAHDILMRIQGRKPYEVDLPVTDEEWILRTMEESHQYLRKSFVMDMLSNTKVIAEEVEDYGVPIEEFSFPSFKATQKDKISIISQRKEARHGMRGLGMHA